MRNAMNEVLRDWYVDDCQPASTAGTGSSSSTASSDRLRLPDRKFNRDIGMYAGFHFDPNGVPLIAARSGSGARTSGCRRRPTSEYLLSLMATPVYEPGKFANYIAPPRRGINQLPVDFEYVRTEEDK